MRPSKARDGLALCLGVVLLCSLVQAVGAAKGDVLIFPGLGEILRALWDMLGDAKTWKMIGVTMRHVVTAMLISSAGGVMLGLAMGLSRFVRQMMKPVMALLRTIPMIVLIVVVMVLTSYDRVPVVASVLVLIPMIAEATSEGCQHIDRELLDVYRINSGLNLRVLWRVHLPLMSGYLSQAWVNAAGMAVKLAVSAEYLVQTKNSLGKVINSEFYFGDFQDVYAYALIMILLVLLLSELPLALIRRLQK